MKTYLVGYSISVNGYDSTESTQIQVEDKIELRSKDGIKHCEAYIKSKNPHGHSICVVGITLLEPHYIIG